MGNNEAINARLLPTTLQKFPISFSALLPDFFEFVMIQFLFPSKCSGADLDIAMISVDRWNMFVGLFFWTFMNPKLISKALLKVGSGD